MKSIYLDQNVLIDIQNKRKLDVVEAVEKIDRNSYQILFSPAHIEEIAASKMHHGSSDKEVNFALDFLANTTGSKALLPFKRNDTAQVKKIGVYLSSEHPRVTYKRVIDDYWINHIPESHQKEKIRNGENFERIANVSSKEINNIDIQNEINIFKPKLHQIILRNYRALLVSDPLSAKYLPSKEPQCDQISFEFLGKFFPLHEMTIEKIFEFLEVRRYFPDKSTQFLSGLHDTTHAIYAAYCDIFVTNDKKLKSKTKAAYGWLGINTLVLSPDEFIGYFSTDLSE